MTKGRYGLVIAGEDYKPEAFDVGCSRELRGDVNVDLHVPLNLMNREFVKADGQHLPFINNVFSETTCFHLIEEVKNPYLLLSELQRVTKGKVTVKCPYRFSLTAKGKAHRHYFNKKWFSEQLKGKPHHIRVSLDTDRDILRFPLEITARVWKHEA